MAPAPDRAARRLRHDDLRRDVRARRAHRRDQPRPGLPRHRRPARGARGRGRGDPRRPQPVPAGPGDPRAARRRSPRTSAASTASSSTPTARCSSRPARPRRSPPRCSRCASRATRSSRSSPTTTPTPPCIALAGADAPRRDAAPARLRASTPTRWPPRSRRARALVLLNSPHNPTGKVFSPRRARADRRAVPGARRARVTDEVYEHLVFDGARAHPARHAAGHGRAHADASPRPARRSRVTGWKIGWATGPRALVGAVADRQAVPHLRQRRAVPARDRLRARRCRTPTSKPSAPGLQAKRDRLCAGLEAAGLTVLRPAGTYFVTTDIRAAGRGGRPRLLPLAAGARGGGRGAHRRLLRRQGRRPAARPLRVLQARRGDRRGGGQARRADASAYTPSPCPGRS